MSTANDVSVARDRLLRNRFSFVIVKNGKVITESKSSGIKALVDAIAIIQENMAGAALADKVVGRAAILLAAKAKIGAVYAKLLSVPALELASTLSISLIYDRTTAKILNRRKDDTCPFEKMVAGTVDPEKAFQILKECTMDSSVK
jgi:hypothetical protein